MKWLRQPQSGAKMKKLTLEWLFLPLFALAAVTKLLPGKLSAMEWPDEFAPITAA